MRALGGAVLMALVLVLYLVLVLARAAAFIGSGQPVGIAIGVALIVLPLIGAYLLVRELVFGLQATRLTRRLGAEGPLPGAGLPTRASGRVERAAADAEFPQYAEAAEAHPDDWRAGDRRRARAAVRRAITLSR